MHPCLCIDEILRPIAREVVASGWKETAVALACCCKSFEDPVLDVLWETQDGLAPLLETLPQDVWEPGGYSVCFPAIDPFPIFSSTFLTVFQETPDETGMCSLPRIFSKDANT